MFGGIPNSEIDQLQKYWDVLPEFKTRIFKPVEGKPYSLLTDENLDEIAKESRDMITYWRQYFEAFKDFVPWMENILIDRMMEVKEMEAHDRIAAEIFRRMENVPIIDPYDIYQMFSDQWPVIINDIEVLQTEGLDATRTVEPSMKLVKKGDEEIEVEDGMKGRILPFKLVQEEEFNYELRLIDEKVQHEEEIASEIEEIRDGFTEDESQEYLNEKENLDTSKIKKDAKAKNDDIEPETKEKLKKLVALWDEKSKLDKALKAERKALEEKTIAHIQNLTDEEIKRLLELKWIDPVMIKILANVNDASFIIDKVKALAQKYAVSYHDLNAQLVEAQDELAGLITQLEGDESSIEGLNALMNSFKN